MLDTLRNAWRAPDLRRKVLFTIGILVIFRFIAHVPLPGVDVEELNRLFQQNQLLGMLDLFSGGGLRNLSVAAMGVYPYITASIIMQLMVPVIPALEAMQKEGEAGRQAISRYTHWLTVPLAFLQGYGQLVLLQSQNVITGIGFGAETWLPTLAMIISMTAGTVLLVWMGELITENGVGNGVSILIFGGIAAGLPQLLGQSFIAGADTNFLALGALAVLSVVLVGAIVFFQEAQRRVPVQYTRSMFRGGRMYRQSGASHIPLKVNSAGMIPLIFAMSIMLFPPTIASYFTVSNVEWVRTVAQWLVNFFSTTNGFYWIFYFLLVVGFTFFYTMVVFQQQNIAETLQKNGGFVPGIRPGKPTADYFNGVLNRITWAGALFLGFIAILPFVVEIVTGIRSIQIGSTSLLIVVGVVLDTMKQLEAQLLMRQYEGFIR